MRLDRLKKLVQMPCSPFTVFIQGGSSGSIPLCDFSYNLLKYMCSKYLLLVACKHTRVLDVKRILIEKNIVPSTFWHFQLGFITLSGRFLPLDDKETFGELALGSLSHLRICISNKGGADRLGMHSFLTKAHHIENNLKLCR